jgi:hypothetical protein
MSRPYTDPRRHMQRAHGVLLLALRQKPPREYQISTHTRAPGARKCNVRT